MVLDVEAVPLCGELCTAVVASGCSTPSRVVCSLLFKPPPTPVSSPPRGMAWSCMPVPLVLGASEGSSTSSAAPEFSVVAPSLTVSEASPSCDTTDPPTLGVPAEAFPAASATSARAATMSSERNGRRRTKGRRPPRLDFDRGGSAFGSPTPVNGAEGDGVLSLSTPGEVSWRLTLRPPGARDFEPSARSPSVAPAALSARRPNATFSLLPCRSRGELFP